MTTLTTTAQTTPETPLYSVPLTKISKITSIEIDNTSTSSVTIKFIDKFLPSPSENNENPTEVSELKKVITVQPNSHFSETELDIDIFGELWIISNVDDTNVVISVTFTIE